MNPRALAGAIIYLASQNCNEFLRQAEICQIADISTVSLRKKCTEIKLLSEFNIGQKIIGVAQCGELVAGNLEECCLESRIGFCARK